MPADLNFDFLKFNNFFVNDECVNEIDDKVVYKDKTEENLKKMFLILLKLVAVCLILMMKISCFQLVNIDIEI